mmetsp:Transcript_52946/g.126015  ORF Transcript_52946/g.126015 Transcript_52946/m.126015 type:complete len:228 (-) Transcript_52946:558-1241(-)
MAATPTCPPVRWREWRRVETMRAPLHPMGCPSTTAPPHTSTLEGSRSRMRWLARATTEKAWLISHRSTSDLFNPAYLSALGMAIEGAVGKSMGACSASANDTIRASGFNPSSSAFWADMRTRAHAPSLSDDEFAAVTFPTSAGLKAGLREEIRSILTLRGSSSCLIVVDSPFLPSIFTGTISLSNQPFLIARLTREYDSRTWSSISSREIPWSIPHFSAHSPMWKLP